MIWPWIIGALIMSVAVSSLVGMAAIYRWGRWWTAGHRKHVCDLLGARDLAQE
jgi:hypothetical protein